MLQHKGKKVVKKTFTQLSLVENREISPSLKYILKKPKHSGFLFQRIAMKFRWWCLNDWSCPWKKIQVGWSFSQFVRSWRGFLEESLKRAKSSHPFIKPCLGTLIFYHVLCVYLFSHFPKQNSLTHTFSPTTAAAANSFPSLIKYLNGLT